MDTDYIVAVMKPHNEVICYKSLCFLRKILGDLFE